MFAVVDFSGPTLIGVASTLPIPSTCTAPPGVFWRVVFGAGVTSVVAVAVVLDVGGESASAAAVDAAAAAATVGVAGGGLGCTAANSLTSSEVSRSRSWVVRD